ncbi:maleylpyruvate isomerase N-terminal domain-containing protein [Pseudonocardia sp. C8]|uniref:maleylpyruvate isomerase N-terminal domain-containing protein n=1 Tax=Pseudonocardia sp. C8 TaxID=2762759 RepID=UPI00164300F1|nr:maleylpyruvate isomerase N-terminal domain-containing protein [Pseudonocardia sp. C8]MBC3190148.1 maleylpyruvate isomerase N-terminal domain-containing protein [Pseudonocardia sp. C8]
MTTTSEVERVLRDQWAVLRAWIEDERVLDHASEPSGLGGWTVGDLVVHLGFGLRMVADLGSAAGREPIGIAEYVAGYAPAQHRIAAETAGIAASARGAELRTVDRLADETWQALDGGLPDVVLGRRGPLRRDDFLLTRLIELVTHGDDLHRRLGPQRPGPLVGAAVALVCGVFAAAYEEATGRPPRWRGLELVRVATGRIATGDPAVPLLS